MKIMKTSCSVVSSSTAIALCLILILPMTSAALSIDYCAEIRGPVYNGSDIDNVIDTLGNGETVTVDATKFAGFYYDHDKNMATESLSIRDVEDTQGNVIGEHGLVYQTTIQNTNYKFESWDIYPVIGLFGELYVPLKPTDASKLAKLILDSNENNTLNIGDILDLGQGYTLEVKQIDIEGEKIWLEFDKDGKYVDDQIIVADGDGTWTCKLDNIQGENDITVLKVHVKQVFQNAVNSTAIIDGLWLIDYATTLNITDEFSKLSTASIEGKVISENDLKYNTTIENVNYNYSNSFSGWDKYPVIYLFGEKYVPLRPTDSSKLAKLILDSNETHTLINGNIIDLGKGYTLKIKQIDVDGNRVWLEFDKYGQYVDDRVVSVNNGDNAWTTELNDIQGENDVVVLKVHVKNVFLDADTSVCIINGLWLIDYFNAIDIYSSSEYGKLNDLYINGTTLIISNKYIFTLNRNSEQKIAKEIYFKVIDTPVNELRFYLFKQIIEPGIYEVRGEVAKDNSNFRWDARNFAGFYYDFDSNVATESLSISNINENTIGKNELVYNTSIKEVAYKYKNEYNDWGTYPVIGLFGEKYVPLNTNNTSKLAKLVLDSNDKRAINTGDILDLGQGYTLKVKLVDIDGDKVWLEFDKDGKYVNDAVVPTEIYLGTWDVKIDNVQGENNVLVLRVHVKTFPQSSVNGTTMIDGLWLIDYANPMNIQSSDEFCKLNNISINGTNLSISNRDAFTLTRGSDQEIGQGIYFRIANTSVAELRYYPFVKRIIEESSNKTLPVADFGTNITSGYAPLTVQFTDLSQNSVGRLWDFNNDWQGDSVEAAPIYMFTNSGSYSVNLIAINENGTALKTATITAMKKSSSSDSKGSSGGGGSPEPAKNVKVKELSKTFVISGKQIKFEFPKNATCISNLSFDSKKTVGKTTAIVEMLNNKSILTPDAPEGEIYSYLNIWVGNSGYGNDEVNLENATITFKVEKSWVQDKGIDKYSIILNRYSNKKWNELPRTLLREDNKYLYFKAESPGLSPFAITGETSAKEVVPETPLETKDNEKNNSCTALVEQQPESEEKASTFEKKSMSTPGFEIIYSAICLSGFFLCKRWKI